MARRALITGAAGFAGPWLAGELLRQGWSVWGTALEPGRRPADAPITPDEWRAVTWLEADVRKSADLSRALDAARPDAVFHLAGVTFVPKAGNDPAAACEVNTLGVVRLLAGIRTRRAAGVIDPAVLVIGSGQQYGRHAAADMPLSESTPQRPLEIYGASKAAQEVLALEAFRAEGVRVVLARSFNHSGRGQRPPLLLPSLVERALALRGTARPRMPIGNTDTTRDFSHVADVARAYIQLAERGTAGEAYNVCSGIGRTTLDLAARVMSRVGVTAELEPDPALMRKVEVPVLIGDNAKLCAATGWRPLQTVDDIIDDLIHAATH